MIQNNLPPSQRQEESKRVIKKSITARSHLSLFNGSQVGVRNSQLSSAKKATTGKNKVQMNISPLKLSLAAATQLMKQ